MIEKVLNEHKILKSDSLSFKSLYQLIQIINISSAQNFEYYNIECFLIEAYQTIKNHKSKERQLFYHIEILYLISKTLFRNKKFIESLEYLDLMHFYMEENKGKYQKEFDSKYQLLLDLGNIDVLDYRILSFKRNYFKHLKNIKQGKVIIFLQLVEMYYGNPEIIKDPEFHQKAENSFL